MNVKQDGLQYATTGISTFAAMERWLDEAIANVPNFGLSVKPGSRLLRAREIIAQLNAAGGSLGELQIEEVTASTFDAYQWRCILEMASRRPHDPIFEQRLKKALRGGIEFGKPNQGRDAQFELFTLASLKSDLSPKLRSDIAGGADIILENAGIAIEAKRPTSKDRFWQLFKEGADQVHEAAQIGVIATDLTAFIDHRWPPRVEQYNEAGPALAQNLEQVMRRELASELNRDLTLKPSLSVWSAAVWRFFDVAGTIIGPLGCWVHLPLNDDDAVADRQRVAEVFAHPGSFSFFEPE